jgi:hypothetical protein
MLTAGGDMAFNLQAACSGANKEAVRARDRVHPNPARPGQLGRHRHQVLRTSPSHIYY